MLSTGAWNAMLKLLEEPPKTTIFLLCTTDPQKIPATILSRVQRYDFQKISFEGIVHRLLYIIQEEGGIEFEREALEYIAKALAPAEVLSVEINESLKASQVIVPDDKLSLAIGKKGQNVRLAAKLTGWKIDVKPKSKADSSLESMPDYEITSIDDDDDTFANLEDIT